MSDEQAQQQPGLGWRLATVAVALLVLAVLALTRLLTLQVLDTERGYQFLQAQGDARTVREVPVPAHRGSIVDRHGEPLAVSTPMGSVVINPQRVMPEGVAVAAFDQALPEVARLLDQPVATLRQRIERAAQQGSSFLYLQRRLPPQQAQALLKTGMPGLSVLNEPRRYYPAAEVASQLIGFTNVDDQGQEGIELAFDQWLQGLAGSKRVIKDLRGNVVRDLEEVRPRQAGGELRLSIDLRLQYLAYRELASVVHTTGAKGGSVVIVEVATGEVLAMVNQPSFNPNNRAQFDPAAARNRAVTDLFEPGSTMKPFTVAAALMAEVITPRTVIDTHPGYVTVGRKRLMDPVNYGALDITHILTKSSQVGTTKIVQRLPDGELESLFSALGFGHPSGSLFPGESSGFMPEQRRSEIEKATLGFGYGLSGSALQLARAYTALAADGSIPQISLLHDQDPPNWQPVLPPAVARQVREMLVTVTEKGGTGTRAAVPGYRVAGKTGTVHKVGPEGYAHDRYRSIFAGLIPATRPALVGVVVVDEPAGERYYGGEVAAPVFGNIMRGAMRILSIPPDDDAFWQREARS